VNGFNRARLVTESFAPGTLVDFSNLPLQSASALLQVLGRQIFEGLMGQPSSLEWPADWDGEGPVLWQASDIWPGAEAIEPRTENSVLPGWRKFLKRRYARKVILGKVSEDSFVRRMQIQVQTAFRQDTVLGLSIEQWALAGEAAWQDIAFQHQLYREMDRRLRSEVLLEGGRPPNAFFSSRAIWVLVGLAATQPVAPGLKMNKALRKLKEPLAQVSARMGLVDGWAGYWDQWLMVRALPLVRRTYAFQDSRIIQAVKMLPLRQALGTKALPRYDEPPRFFFSRLGWYLRYGFARLASQLRQLPIKFPHPPVLAQENWSREKPEWAEPFEPRPRKT